MACPLLGVTWVLGVNLIKGAQRVLFIVIFFESLGILVLGGAVVNCILVSEILVILSCIVLRASLGLSLIVAVVRGGSKLVK